MCLNAFGVYSDTEFSTEGNHRSGLRNGIPGDPERLKDDTAGVSIPVTLTNPQCD